MSMTVIAGLLLIAAIAAFLLDALKIPAGVSWTPLGFALVTAAAMLLVAWPF
jgi:hypothetical protein